MTIGRNASHAAVAGFVLVWAALTVIPFSAALFALSDDDESSITLGAALVKPYQYSGDNKEITVSPGKPSGSGEAITKEQVETGQGKNVVGDVAEEQSGR